MNIESTPTIFARLSDQPGMFACLTYEFPAPGSSDADWNAFLAQGEQGPKYSEVASDMSHDDLPLLRSVQAREVAEHSYYSGANLAVTAQVMAQRGAEAMHDYADTQNVYSMPGAPNIPEEELKWIGSGLTPVKES